MKKLILSLTLLLTVSMSAFAEEFPYNGIMYNILSEEDKTVEVGYNPSFNGSELIIPEKVTYFGKEYTVTAIGKSFFNNTFVTSVSIPATMKTIGDEAFRNCKNLTSLTFEGESQLEQIGNYAFTLSGLTTISIPATVKTIGNNAFQECGNLTSLTFEGESQLEQIGQGAFYNTVLTTTTIDIPASVTSIGTYAFYGNTALQQVYMHCDDPSGYSYDAFCNCPDVVIYAPAASYEAYIKFNTFNKVEVELTEWKTYAENKIEEGLNALNTLSDEDRKDVNECLSNITTAVTFDVAYAAFNNAMPIINAQINLEKKLKDAIGIFATRKNGPTIEIRANDGTTIKLYNIEKVNFGKQGE